MAEETNKEVQPKQAGRNAILDMLRTSFPVFRDHRPLALGIHKTIRERFPDLNAGQLRTAMRIHTTTTAYLKALASGDQRFDLDGQPAGEVTAEQKEQAASDLRERFKKGAERRKAEQKAQREEEQRQEKLLKLAEKFNTR